MIDDPEVPEETNTLSLRAWSTSDPKPKGGNARMWSTSDKKTKPKKPKKQTRKG
jgi:hypothetical protein